MSVIFETKPRQRPKRSTGLASPSTKQAGDAATPKGTAGRNHSGLNGGMLGPEASRMVFVVLALLFFAFKRAYPAPKFPGNSARS